LSTNRLRLAAQEAQADAATAAAPAANAASEQQSSPAHEQWQREATEGAAKSPSPRNPRQQLRLAHQEQPARVAQQASGPEAHRRHGPTVDKW